MSCCHLPSSTSPTMAPSRCQAATRPSRGFCLTSLSTSPSPRCGTCDGSSRAPPTSGEMPPSPTTSGRSSLPITAPSAPTLSSRAGWGKNVLPPSLVFTTKQTTGFTPDLNSPIRGHET
ncbi:uncharacterized protein LOC122266149 [Penaeus japonicus]|uniref:uncharacterized protein LOC122266149 n=1 Tax=Penaeus japonicus TaxID=27405 RepID=UPI001C70B07C|nr:uncharacterized protein LOC122266149 [Penaeus japonicus]